MKSNRTLQISAFAVFFSLFSLFYSQASWAFICNSSVVDTGLKKAEVLNKCGPPSTREYRTEQRTVRVRSSGYPTNGPSSQGGVPGPLVQQERTVVLHIEEWVYNLGPQRFMQELVFEDGLLITVRDLGYGS
jgi:hypothetical protein